MGAGSPIGWGIKENHLHLSDSSNLKFLLDSLDTGFILLKMRPSCVVTLSRILKICDLFQKSLNRYLNF